MIVHSYIIIQSDYASKIIEAIWALSGGPRFGRFAALSNVFWVVLAWFFETRTCRFCRNESFRKQTTTYKTHDS